jgi:uncharacterized protein YndB with AHSA1/START domain
MLRNIAIGVVVVIVAILGFAATKPDSFRVQRSTNIKAPPEKIFPLIDDYHRWTVWSPYEKMDPTMQRSYSGAASGKGAVYEWAGDGNAGAGRMEILESVPSSKVKISLDFTKPFETHNIVVFSLEPQGDSTQVTWDMQGPAPFISKLMQVFFSLDSMIGKDFETGLADMKAAAEKT